MAGMKSSDVNLPALPDRMRLTDRSEVISKSTIKNSIKGMVCGCRAVGRSFQKPWSEPPLRGWYAAYRPVRGHFQIFFLKPNMDKKETPPKQGFFNAGVIAV
jgi:hypothetical protein